MAEVREDHERHGLLSGIASARAAVDGLPRSSTNWQNVGSM
jgi:hypothetical protein